jgi:transcriptional regulator with XRE-family HTH domain
LSTINYEKFAERFNQLKTEQNTSTVKIARMLDIGQSSVAKFGLGTSKPTFYNLLKLADIFGVSLDYLVGRTDNPNSHKL